MQDQACTFGFSKLHSALLSGAVDPCLAFALALWGSFPESALPAHVGVRVSQYPRQRSVRSVWAVLLCSHLIPFGCQEHRRTVCWQSLHLTFPGALSGKDILFSLCFPRLPLAACQHEPQSGGGCSAAPTVTQVQGFH